MIFATGDTHQNLDIMKLKNFNSATILTKQDYVIICGDFGLFFTGKTNPIELELLKLYNNFNFTTLFVDGNHDNFPILDNLPMVKMFGSNVGKISNSIYHLKRGQVYNINDCKFFTMGGALSVDKHNRTPYKDWWDREIPSTREFKIGHSNLKRHNYKVDYIISHTAPSNILEEYFSSYNCNYSKNDDVSDYLEKIVRLTEFKTSYFGHCHDDWTSKCGKFRMLYDDMIQIV